MASYRYSCWDGSQQVFPVLQEDLMGQLSEHLVNHGDISSALRSLAQSGLRGRFGGKVSGIQGILQRLRSIREEALDRCNLEHILDGLKDRLKDLVQAERRGIEERLDKARSRMEGGGFSSTSTPSRREMQRLLRRLDEMSRRSREFLDSLPREPAEAIARLKEYEFTEEEARAGFDDLIRSLQQQVLDSSFSRLSEELRSASPGQISFLKGMLGELNEVLEEHLDAGASPGHIQFHRFMQRHGKLFGSSPPASVEELAEEMYRQRAQMESLLKSLSPELRGELEEVIRSIFREQELAEELARLAANLDLMCQGSMLAGGFLFRGPEPLGLEEVLEMMRFLQRTEELERQLKRTQQGHQLDSVDTELLREVMGEETYQAAEQLRHMADVLEDAGYVRWDGSRYELTPKGIRKMGQKALQEIFSSIGKDRLGPIEAGPRGPEATYWRLRGSTSSGTPSTSICSEA